jgi:putative PIN family toxin of toxin-antitoxin system
MNKHEPPQVVFDCNVLLQAVASPRGPAFQSLDLFQTGQIHLLMSDSVYFEARKVFSHPKIIAHFPRLTPDRVEAFFEKLREKALYIEEVPSIFTYLRAPEDEQYLNLAIAAQPDYLVSRDKDLLDLAKEHNPDGQRFRTLVPSVTIVNPVEFLQAMNLRYQNDQA